MRKSVLIKTRVVGLDYCIKLGSITGDTNRGIGNTVPFYDNRISITKIFSIPWTINRNIWSGFDNKRSNEKILFSFTGNNIPFRCFLIFR